MSRSANCAEFDFAQAQTDSALLGVDADDPQVDHITFMQNFLRVFNAILADLRDMDQAFDVAFQPGKCAKLGQAGDDTFHQHANLELANLILPGIVLQGADGKTDAFLLAVDADDLDFDFLPHLERFAGMLNALPGNFGEMDKPVSAVDVDERAKISQAGDAPGPDLAFLQFFDDAFLERLARFGIGSPFGKDQASALRGPLR